MAGGLDVVVEFLADTSKLQKEAAKVEGTGGKLKGWAKGVGAAIGAAFAVDQIKQFVDAAAGLQDAMSATQQIFGSAAGDVVKFSKGTDKGLGISQKAALDASDTFATFGKSAGLTGKPLAQFATKLTSLAGDLASFRGTSPEQAIEAIGAALRGETEPIRAYGVLLDDATLRQTALAMGLIKTTKDALTPQQKVLAAQAQLFKQTGDAQGDFQRTSESAANQQKVFAAEMENTRAALGTALLPALQIVLPILQDMAGFIKDNATWLVPLTAAVLGVAAAIWVWNAAMAANPIGLITVAVALLIAGIILLAKNWDTVWAGIKRVLNSVWGFIQGVFAGIVSVAHGVINWLANNWPLLLAILTGPFGLAVLAIVNNWNSIVGFFQGLIGTIGDIFVNVASAIAAPFRFAFNAIANLWNNTIGRLSFKIPGWVPGLGGHGWDVPDIPTFAQGGVMPHTGLALLHQGETVTPAARAPARGPAVHIETAVFSSEVDIDLFLRRAAWTVQTQRI